MTEAWEDIEKVLEPLLRDIASLRLAAGCTIEQCIPVFHATDSYGKHRSVMRALYRRIWPTARIQIRTRTPKGNILGARVEADMPTESVCVCDNW